jgi:hypothetical protein
MKIKRIVHPSTPTTKPVQTTFFHSEDVEVIIGPADSPRAPAKVSKPVAKRLSPKEAAMRWWVTAIGALQLPSDMAEEFGRTPKPHDIEKAHENIKHFIEKATAVSKAILEKRGITP